MVEIGSRQDFTRGQLLLTESSVHIQVLHDDVEQNVTSHKTLINI